MLFRGSERQPTAFALSLAIESLGGTLGAATYADFTSFAMTVPPESLHEQPAMVPTATPASLMPPKRGWK